MKTDPQKVQARLRRLRKAGRRRRGQPKPGAAPDSPSSPPSEFVAPSSAAAADKGCLAELPGMSEVEGTEGRYLLRTVRYPLDRRQGRFTLGELLAASHKAVGELCKKDEFDVQRAIFLDTETSGLAGGAGTIVFLTGVGVFEDDAYVVRQYFARNPAEERAYLPDLARFIAQRRGLVTFNGRAFDWPLLRFRFLLNNVIPPDELPHIDLLHHARRLWRSRLGACNFGNLERRILEYHRRGQDIPSWMIPRLWFDFARGQSSVQEMAGVLYHNLEDVVSMVPLAHVIAATLAGEMPPHPHDWLALGRVWQGEGQIQQAETAYRRALAEQLPPTPRAQAMRELALLLKRSGRRDEAVVWWEELAAMEQQQNVEALVELAKHYEWQTGELHRARAWTEEAIRRAQTWPSTWRRRQILAELEHRRRRLEKKVARNLGKSREDVAK